MFHGCDGVLSLSADRRHTSSSQAQAACEACFGSGNCSDTGTHHGAAAWAGNTDTASFTYSYEIRLSTPALERLVQVATSGCGCGL
jgi:hypothetical protein